MRRIIVDMQNLLFADAIARTLRSADSDFDVRRSESPDKTPEVQIGNIKSSEFTEAEVRVLHLMVEGMTYKEMAEELGVTTDCVKKHISSMLSKTGYPSKTKLTAMVVSKRLIVNGF